MEDNTRSIYIGYRQPAADENSVLAQAYEY